MTIPLDPAARPPSGLTARTALAALLALLLLSASLLVLAPSPAARTGALLLGVALLAATAAATLSLARRGRPPRDAAALFAALAHALATAAAAIHAGIALPEDLHLFTLGRPPQAIWGYAVVVAALAIDGARSILDGRSPRAAFLPLLVGCSALEGLPLATPPWLLLGLAATAFVVGPPAAPSRSLAVPAACGFLAATFALSGWFGADFGTSLDPILRVASLALCAAVIAGEGIAGARRVVAALLLAAIAVGALAVTSKLLLARLTSGLDLDVLGSELSLFGRHPNSLAPWFGATAILALAATRARAPGAGVDPLRILAYAAIPFALGSLLLTASRLAIGATIAAACLGFVLRTRAGRRGIAIAAGCGAAALVLALGATTIAPLRAKLAESLDAAQSLDHRSFRMRVGIAAALDRPLLGHGPACWFVQGAFTPRTQYEGESSEDHPHCLPVAVWQNAGILGLTALASLLLATGLAARRSLRPTDGPRDPALATGALLASAAQLATNLLDMGDALATTIPSRLPIDAATIAALDPAAAPGDAPPSRRAALMLVFGLGLLAVHVGFARAEAASARELAREGFTDRALASFERAARRLPIDASLRLDHARVAFGAKKRAEARDAIEHALVSAPRRPEAHEAQAVLKLALDDREGARAAARRALELDPHGATGRRLGLLLAELELDAGDETSALARLAATIRIDARAFSTARDPERPDSLRLGRHSVPLARVYDALRAALPSDAPPREAMRVDLRIFELALGANDLATAERALADYRGHEPDAISIDKFEGKLRLAQGRGQEALFAFDRAASRLPDPGLLADRGDALLALGRIDEALEAYRAAMPSSRDVYFHAYAYHDALNRLAAALERAPGDRSDELRTVLAALETFVAADFDRAKVLLRLAAAQTREADRDAALHRALFALLRCDDSKPVRGLATEIGRALADLGTERPDRSAYADHLEREATARNAGAPTHAFRVALLSGLGLTRRAADAERDLLAFPR